MRPSVEQARLRARQLRSWQEALRQEGRHGTDGCRYSFGCGMASRIAAHGESLILTSFKGAPALSRRRMAPCQLFSSLMTLKTMTFNPFFKITFPWSESSISVRGSLNA